MATLGQVVYNLQDFHASGGLISTSDSNKFATVSSTSQYYSQLRYNIFKKDIANDFSTGNGLLKVGIQAPPGTKVKLNNTKTIMIGRSGIYETDPDIKITGLIFLRPYKYIKDVDATAQSLQEAQEAFEGAEAIRTQKLASLNSRYPSGTIRDENYWQEYTEIQDTYNTAYNLALPKYLEGVNGIYRLKYPNDLDNEENYDELYNVIVDFLY